MWRMLVCALALITTSCAHSPQHPDRNLEPIFGYRCEAQRSGSFGIVEVDINMRDGQKPHGYVKWDAGDGAFKNPWITAAWYMDSSGEFEPDNGYVNVMWHIWQIDGVPRDTDEKLSLQYRVSTNERSYGNANLSSPYQRSGGPFHISVDWSLLYSIAAGTDELYLIAVDEDRAEQLRIEIDHSIFAAALPHVIDVMRLRQG
ncbi:MAG: hypothetical protein AAFY42_09110 [Pseudomonadota bacterium]